MVIENIFKNNKYKNKLTFSISYTTRPPRKTEVNGREYIFVSRKEFLEKINSKEIIEHNIFLNNYYGTSLSQLKEITIIKNMLLDIEFNGVINLKKVLPNIISILIMPLNKNYLNKNLKKRDTDNLVIQKQRIESYNNFHSIMDNKNYFDYVVINKHNRIEEVIEEINSILDNFF